jgi:isoleucyl-tRNA synthetase
MSTDYKSTVFLPQTEFPMRGDLPKREPDLLARWKKMDLHRLLREGSKGKEKYVLHDGPPYANGNLHIGTALNKILKDIVNRAHQMLGKDANYVPGWDCHGLPIEWKIEEEYRAKKKNKDEVPIVEFRKECREFAARWIEIQKAEFVRLGVEGDWDNYYSTMSYKAEAQIARELGKFVENGGLYRGSRPVMWSVVEKTALAEAEIEYHDHTSTTVWVRFPVLRSPNPALQGAAVVIWTTTPWTLPGNRAIAAGADIEYDILTVKAVHDDSLVKVGDRLVVAKKLATYIVEDLKIGEAEFDWGDSMRVKGKDLLGTVCAHPLHGQGYEFEVPVLNGEFVTDEDGTGFVHIAPGHGADDYELGRANNIEVPDTVSDDGSYYPHVPLFAGKRVYTPRGKQGDANEAVIAAIKDAGNLLARGEVVHSYPHSWRSKAPLIFRNTPQWFISMSRNDLRNKALRAIDDTKWFPAQGRNRIRSMIESRPDWCISRQRAWGVPIAVFFNKKTGELLRDPAVMERVAQAFEAEGADAWYASKPERFLGNQYKADEWEQVKDIVDVWFDSGSTHSFVLEQRPDLKWPASLYLEGSDQHRGWFHSSLLESCGTRGRAPYDAVLTHGFVLDEQGRKMSKSLGNVVAPQEVAGKLGADILRLWVVSSDYSEDLRIGGEILKHHAELYRRLRNTLRYLLGNLAGFSAKEAVDLNNAAARAGMPELDRWILHRLAELDRALREAIATYTFTGFYTALHNFCAVDLSAFYFDIRKDALYCDPYDDLRRRSARTVLDRVYECLVRWLAPVLCFSAEEAWLARHPGDTESVHLQTFVDIPAAWTDDMLGRKWERIREVRRVVTGALERARADKKIGSSLQAKPVIYLDNAEINALLSREAWSEVFITSDHQFTVGAAPADAFQIPDVAGIAVVVELAGGEKCERCWRVLPDVGADHNHSTLCGRCVEAVSDHPAAAQ